MKIYKCSEEMSEEDFEALFNPPNHAMERQRVRKQMFSQRASEIIKPLIREVYGTEIEENILDDILKEIFGRLSDQIYVRMD